MSSHNFSKKSNKWIYLTLFLYPDDSEILVKWILISSFQYFRVISIEKQISSFIFWEKLQIDNFCFEISKCSQKNIMTFFIYHAWAIITRCLYTFNPFLWGQLINQTPKRIYEFYCRAVCHQERFIMVRVIAPN